MSEFLANKTILVTGGTGTFGRAFISRLLSSSGAKKIIVFSRDEFKQHHMQRELNDARLRFFLGDVRDLPRLQRAFHEVDIVVHAAALKQVPAVEYNPLEAIKTNIMGTQNVVDAALDNSVERVLFISSDKAVQPVNLYGATKLCAEKIIVGANVYRGERGPRFSVMRYGNVWGSRGSLIELIERQRQTGVVTLTDERMTRFWIKIETVMKNIEESLETMHGGEIFIPKMFSSYIADVIAMLAPDCRVQKIGIRPGEKLHEVLITEHEALRTHDIGNLFVISPEFVSWGGADRLSHMKKIPNDFYYVSNSSDFLKSAEDMHHFFKTI
ncbi:MAG: UDP-N-acetylglucosamine 4,6-dehydratase (inverting) [bacterium]|nr:UDP-N-acetylglucosamine 4,6-dehydratase (inverting) [bacterium]